MKKAIGSNVPALDKCNDTLNILLLPHFPHVTIPFNSIQTTTLKFAYESVKGLSPSTTHHHYHTIPKRYRRPSIKVLKRHGESKHKITYLRAQITLQNS